MLDTFLDTCTQLSKFWQIPNSVRIGFDPAMKMGSSRRFQRYPTTYMWVSSQLPFREELFTFWIDVFMKKWTSKFFHQKVLRRENSNSVQTCADLTYSFAQATFACPHFSTNQVEMITQETNPVYWACTHCLTLEPWTVIISTFILVVQFDNTIRFANSWSGETRPSGKGQFQDQ